MSKRKLTLVTTGLVANLDDRTVTGKLLPYGEPGNTNLGKITASAGTLSIVDAADFQANLEHDAGRPVARLVDTEDTADGIMATYRVLATTAGDDLLVEVAEGVRRGLSVEVDEPVIRGGNLMAGVITGSAFVTRPAFPSAQLVASDVGDLPDEDDDEDEDAEDVPQGEDNPVEDDSVADHGDADVDLEADSLDITPDTTIQQLIDAVASPSDQPTDPGASAVTASGLKPAKLAAGARRPSIPTVDDFAARVVAAMKTGDRRLVAALNDITQGGVGADVSAQAFLGELWSGRTYVRRFVPLLDQKPANAYTMKGWRWVTPPEVYDYAGNKAPITSEDVDTESADTTMARLAGGNDIDRKFVDFPDEGFITSYVERLRDSYARKSDAKAAAAIVAGATAITAGTVPTGVASATAALVDGALALIDVGVPTYAIMGNEAYRQLLLTPKDQVLEFLSMSLGLEEGSMAGFKVIPGGSLVDNTQVIVGIRDALTFYELPGVPIRVDAIDIEHGGVDIALFGYYGSLLNDAAGIVSTYAIPTSISAGADYAMTVGDPDGTNHAGDVAPVTLATFPDGTIADVTDAAVLTSATPAKATIVANKVHAVAAGTSVITSTYAGKTDTVTVTVS